MDIFFPYELFAQWFTLSALNISRDPFLQNALIFFIYDTLKILTLMVVITHVMSTVRYYLPIKKMRDILVHRKMVGANYVLATMFGAVTPFCSCSSIPLFIGFLQARIPLGVAFSFMVTSPLINEVAVALFIGIFGWQITLIYVLAAVGVGVVSGIFIDKLKMEKYVEPFVWQEDISIQDGQRETSFIKAFPQLSKEAFDIIKKVLPYLLIGIAVGAFIHGYVPEDFFAQHLDRTGFWSVPIATLLAVPMYTNASGIIPVIHSLVAKGVPIGTAFAFMMASVGLSLPEAMILKRILKWQLLATFFGLVTIGIVIIGYTLNILF